MRLATFCFYLVFLFTIGEQPAFAGKMLPTGNELYELHGSDQQSAVNFSKAGQIHANLTDSPVTPADDLLICQEVEDEDGSNELSKKYRLLADIYDVPSYQSILDFLYNRPRRIDTCIGLVCYRYILHRVLRI